MLEMGSKMEAPVFVETNLGTHIAIAISPDITTGDFKRCLKRAHFSCFPELGVPTIDAVMVKRNSCFYRLPDSLPLKYACHGFRELCFFHIEASLQRRARDSSNTKVKSNNTKIASRKQKLRAIWCLKAVSQGLLSTAYLSRKNKKRKRKNKPKKFNANREISLSPERDRNETPCESLSGAISVSGLIDRYFSNIIELDQVESPSSSNIATICEKNHAKNTISGIMSRSKRKPVLKTPEGWRAPLFLDDPSSVGLRNGYERSEVGKRLASSLKLCESKQRSRGSNLSKSKMLQKPDAGSIARSLVFEMGDGD